MDDGFYSGPVCYRDGWHWSTTTDGNGDEQPDRKLVLEDRFVFDGQPYTGIVTTVSGELHATDGDGSPIGELQVETRYRFATDTDVSWHDRKHGQFVTVEMEDGTRGITVTADEADAVRRFLDERRGGSQ